ncbi:hypothetical protein F5883DRAFT_7640 [Diaporthe sp. PMI_573]|nr:hypothetical protein F5883DRAFT_7640 [Diaporthaceae sp. PMI_573]
MEEQCANVSPGELPSPPGLAARGPLYALVDYAHYITLACRFVPAGRAGAFLPSSTLPCLLSSRWWKALIVGSLPGSRIARLHLSMKDGGPHLLLLEAVSMFKASPAFGVRPRHNPALLTVVSNGPSFFPPACPTSQLPRPGVHMYFDSCVYVSRLFGYRGPSLILALQADGTTKGPAVTEKDHPQSQSSKSQHSVGYPGIGSRTRTGSQAWALAAL